MSRRTAAVVAWTLVGIGSVLGAGGTVMKLTVEGVEGWNFVANDVLGLLTFFVSAVVGALVASRLPANPIGWIFVTMMLGLGASGAAEGYVARALDHDRLGGFTPWAALYANDSFLVFLGTLFFALLLFPDGRVPTRRWRFLLWTGTGTLVVTTVGILLQPGTIDDYPRVTSPTGAGGPVPGWLVMLGFTGFTAALVGSAVSLVVRFRRARGVERQQLTVLMAVGLFATAAFVVSWPLRVVSDELANAITVIGVLAIPAAIGVAMLRYRLYDIDRVISRTLVYGSLTVVLGAAYAGLVLAGQAVFSSFTGGSNLAIAGSTLVVAALFMPARTRVQAFVDRRFYRRRYDAQRTLEAFGARLRDQVELDMLRGDLEAIVHDTMQPAHVSLWLTPGARP